MQENDQIRAAKNPENPPTVMQMRSGIVVMSQSQFLPGYCLLLAYPQVSALNDLSRQHRAEFLIAMGLIGEAIETVCKPGRINYAILGNKDPFLHAHIIPRYDWESSEFKTLPVWRYPDETWSNPQNEFSAEKHSELRDAIKQKLLELLKEASYAG